KRRQTEQSRRRRRDEWRVRDRRDRRHPVEQLHVVLVRTELEVADDQSTGPATERAVLLFVDLPENGRLVDVRRLHKIPEELGLRHVQHANAKRRTRFYLVDEELQAAPGGFELAKPVGVQDL